MDDSYVCSECGAPVEIAVDGSRVWACPHEGGTIIANLDAVVSSDGGVVT